MREAYIFNINMTEIEQKKRARKINVSNYSIIKSYDMCVCEGICVFRVVNYNNNNNIMML